MSAAHLTLMPSPSEQLSEHMQTYAMKCVLTPAGSQEEEVGAGRGEPVSSLVVSA